MSSDKLSVGDALEESVQALLDAGIHEARMEARLIVALALGCTPEQVFGYPEKKLEQNDLVRTRSLVSRRVAREPLALITGKKEFWSLPFIVNTATLIPRPDSETLIEAVLAAYPDKKADMKILDLGTGTGCLLLALLHEYENATGVGTDISEKALEAARANAENLKLANRARFFASDWNEDVSGLGAFDIVVSNPPYVPQGDKSALQPEVALYEPHSALFAGTDGLSAYRTLIPLLPALSGGSGGVFLEVGIGQADAVGNMMETAGMKDISVHRDLAGIVRCVAGKT